ncbi:MAG: hypothetical protein RLP44_03450 [Aggregatilineales bacterium]
MQISRHWRMNAQRYRLEGFRYQNGAVSLQERPEAPQTDELETAEHAIVDVVISPKKEVAA